MNLILKNNSKNFREYNLKNLNDLSRRLLNVEYFVFFGTLLGYCREGNLIEHDDDIDFYVNIIEKNKIVYMLQDMDFFISIHNKYFIQAVRRIEDTETFSDFYFYEDEPERDYLLERWNFIGQPNNVSTHLHVPKDIIYPIKQGKLLNISINIPNDVDGVCRYLYGKSYKEKLKKNKQYYTKIIDHKPVVINNCEEVQMTPIFILVYNNLEALKFTIASFYKEINSNFTIILLDNNSTCGKTINYLKNLEKNNIQIYWNHSIDEKSIENTVNKWMSKNTASEHYFVTDADTSFIKTSCR